MTVIGDTGPYRVGTIWMLDLHEPVRAIAPAVEARFCRIDVDFLPDLVAAVPQYDLAEIMGRFEKGCRCYTAWVGDVLASYGWVSFRQEDIGELDLRIRLLPGEVYIWDCGTIPAFRRKHLYSALLVYILAELRQDGQCRAWIGADLGNEISQWGIKAAGFHHIAYLSIENSMDTRDFRIEGLPDVAEGTVAEARRAFLNDRSPG